MMRTANKFLLPGLGVLAAALFAGSLVIGPAALSLHDIVGGLWSDGLDTAVLIVREVRLPRAILGLMIGATLGLAGAITQGYLRNPLAEPNLIGVSAAAALGAVLTFYTGIASLVPLALPLGGMAGATIAVILIHAIAGSGSVLSLILTGIAISSFASALISLALNLAPNPFAALEIMFWLMGSLTDRSFDHVLLAGPFMIAGWILMLSLGRALDALTLGEETAASLGFNLKNVRYRVTFGVALSVGAATSIAGAIGFVGLVVPHLLRPLVGNRPSALLPASMLGGAVLTLAADIVVRLLSTEREWRLGVVTALVGAPFFLYLILKHRRSLV